MQLKESDVAGTCSNGKELHACLDTFQAHPGIVKHLALQASKFSFKFMFVLWLFKSWDHVCEELAYFVGFLATGEKKPNAIGHVTG